MIEIIGDKGRSTFDPNLAREINEEVERKGLEKRKRAKQKEQDTNNKQKSLEKKVEPTPSIPKIPSIPSVPPITNNPPAIPSIKDPLTSDLEKYVMGHYNDLDKKITTKEKGLTEYLTNKIKEDYLFGKIFEEEKDKYSDKKK